MGGQWDITEEWYALATAYYSETENEIQYNPLTFSNENAADRHRREGIDVAMGWQREKVAGIRLAWSGVHAIVAEGANEGLWIAGVPRQQMNLEGKVWLWDEFSILGGYRLIGTRYAISDYANEHERLPVESLFRVGCRYEPTWWKLEGLSISFTCENLFDRQYCDYAVASAGSDALAWYPASGRSFMLTIRYEF